MKTYTDQRTSAHHPPRIVVEVHRYPLGPALDVPEETIVARINGAGHTTDTWVGALTTGDIYITRDALKMAHDALNKEQS